YRTLIVDCDLRRPMVAQTFGLVEPAEMGASETLTVLEALEDPSATGNPSKVNFDRYALDVLPQFGLVGSPTEVLSHGFSGLIANFRDDYDVIVVDSPPVLPVADALV